MRIGEFGNFQKPCMDANRIGQQGQCPQPCTASSKRTGHMAAQLVSQKNSPRIGGLFLYAGGEDGNRTRLNGFAGRLVRTKIKNLLQDLAYDLLSLLKLDGHGRVCAAQPIGCSPTTVTRAANPQPGQSAALRLRTEHGSKKTYRSVRIYLTTALHTSCRSNLIASRRAQPAPGLQAALIRRPAGCPRINELACFHAIRGQRTIR